MNARRPLVVGLLAGAVSLGAVPLAHAAFRNTGTATSSYSTAALAPPTGASLSRTCVIVPLTGVATSGRFTAVWTPSPTSWAQEQRIVLLTGAGVPVGVERTLAPSVTTTAFDVLLPVGTYRVRISTVFRSWTAEVTTAPVGC